MARFVRVASVSFGGRGRARSIKETVNRNVKDTAKLLKRAAMEEPDIVCLTECWPTLGLSARDSTKAAEEIPGPIFRTVSSIAKEHGTYVICPMIEKKDGRFHNSAVLLDRNGEYVGSYYKIHPTIDEIESGITPGTQSGVFKVDFGILGLAICFDLNFEEVIKGLVKEGAKLVFFPSAYEGGLQLRIWAFNYGVYMVSARGGENSMIVDPLGRILAKSSSYNPIICKTVNLDYEILHLNYNHMKLDSVKKKYGSRVELDVLRPEAVFMLASNTRDATAEDMIDEFKLETRKEYFRRASRIREDALT